MMIDRTLASGGKIKNKEFYFNATAADSTEAMEGTMNDMQGFVDCVPGSTVKGKVYGTTFEVGDIKYDPAMDQGIMITKDVVFKESSVHEMESTIVVLNKIKLTAIVYGNEVTNPFVVTEVYTKMVIQLN